MNINGSDLEVTQLFCTHSLQLKVTGSSEKLTPSWHADVYLWSVSPDFPSLELAVSFCFCSWDTVWQQPFILRAFSSLLYLYSYSFVICTQGNIFIVIYYVLSVSWSFPRPDGSNFVAPFFPLHHAVVVDVFFFCLFFSRFWQKGKICCTHSPFIKIPKSR